ncbi:MAG: excisionase family DNA binding protein [Desulforhopalus sp.]|jgi:excisionase family DNA binding protein
MEIMDLLLIENGRLVRGYLKEIMLVRTFLLILSAYSLYSRNISQHSAQILFPSNSLEGITMFKLLPYHELPDLVTVPEAAKFLGVGRKVVYQLLEFGELKAIRQRSKILIDPCCLYEFRNKGKMC